MKPDERELLERLQKMTTALNWGVPHPRQLVADMGMNEKRAAYILQKWADKSWYEYGVSVMAGWLTDDGKAAK